MRIGVKSYDNQWHDAVSAVVGVTDVVPRYALVTVSLGNVAKPISIYVKHKNREIFNSSTFLRQNSNL